MARPDRGRHSPWRASFPTRTRTLRGMLIPMLGLCQGSFALSRVDLIGFCPFGQYLSTSSCECFLFRALGQMFDKLNSAEQVEETESVVKVLKQK